MSLPPISFQWLFGWQIFADWLDQHVVEVGLITEGMTILYYVTSRWWHARGAAGGRVKL